jgi:hypothetical protein
VAARRPRDSLEKLARMEEVYNDRFELRGGKVSVIVQEHMRGKESTRTKPNMTMHNQRHVEESIYHGVRRLRRCELSTGGRKEGCREIPLERLVVAPVAC